MNWGSRMIRKYKGHRRQSIMIHEGAPGQSLESSLNEDITCDNNDCVVYGDNIFCRGRERECELYKIWERKMIRRSNTDGKN